MTNRKGGREKKANKQTKENTSQKLALGNKTQARRRRQTERSHGLSVPKLVLFLFLFLWNGQGIGSFLFLCVYSDAQIKNKNKMRDRRNDDVIETKKNENHALCDERKMWTLPHRLLLQILPRILLLQDLHPDAWKTWASCFRSALFLSCQGRVVCVLSFFAKRFVTTKRSFDSNQVHLRTHTLSLPSFQCSSICCFLPIFLSGFRSINHGQV